MKRRLQGSPVLLIVGLLVLLCIPGFWWQPHQAASVRAHYQSALAPCVLGTGIECHAESIQRLSERTESRDA
ncbi:hypothetical protein [Levilactobacillus brevis]|uniref:hypothetical protein n=1 Tax=Levilactobacillus brevis TaxID=1580 RepID=UPI001CDD1DCE|nr:hypothetical protein [Levilactobacillus brevis]